MREPAQPELIVDENVSLPVRQQYKMLKRIGTRRVELLLLYGMERRYSSNCSHDQTLVFIADFLDPRQEN